MDILISNENIINIDPLAGRVPYWLVVKYYWRALIGTCGAWCELQSK